MEGYAWKPNDAELAMSAILWDGARPLSDTTKAMLDVYGPGKWLRVETVSELHPFDQAMHARMNECTNALVGIDNPEAFVAAARAVVEYDDQLRQSRTDGSAEVLAHKIDCLRRALAPGDTP